MTLLQSHYIQFCAEEAAKRPFELALSSVFLVFLYFICQDFSRTFLRRPSHFVRQSPLELIRRKKFDAPLVELRPGETYKEVLARGSQLVSCGILP
jgi:hypothetical protein